MHIPDGFLNTITVTTTYIVSVGGITSAVKVANKKLGEKHIPLMGVLAAFIFVAQMLNFPVVGGTSGHIIGTALVAILLGPWSAVIIMSTILVAQSLIFQDGGLLALGANIFNMGIVAGFGAFFIYHSLDKLVGRRGRNASYFIAAWGSVVLASGACAVELAISGTSPLSTVLPAMTGIYALVGIGEGLITVAVLHVLATSRVDLLKLARI